MRTLVFTCLLAAAAAAGETFAVSLGRLEFPAGELPDGTLSHWYWDRAFLPRVVCDGGAEGYLATPEGTRPYAEQTLLVRCDALPVTGTLYLPDASWSRLVRVPFRVARADPVPTEQFEEARRGHYAVLLARDAPGTAWFRHRFREAGGRDDGRGEWPGRDTHLEETYALLTGGRAISENLQLGRELPADAGATDDTVPLDSLEGITVQEMDWAPHLDGVESDPDPLARFIPADQYALFFPTFEDFVKSADAADAEGTPILGLVESRAEDARTKERYERQLCLRTDALSRALGPKLIRSMAVTGGDPYLRTGSDVAILFEPVDAAVLKELLLARRLAAAKASGIPFDVVETEIGIAAPCYGLVSADRSVCSYLLSLQGCLIVSNSLPLLGRIHRMYLRKDESVAALDEYRFFRSRYRRGDPDETAFLVLTDGAIRKWCGPKWRIAASRRVRAAAVLGELTARHRDAILEARPPDPLGARFGVVDLGIVRATPQGVQSSTYNTAAFLTPIAELEFSKVTEQEAGLYRSWRGGYQSNWSQYFDPIAVRLTLRDDRIAADVTVMPLILATEYGDLAEVSRGARIGDGGDRHAGALFHAILAINTESELFKQADGFAAMMLAGLGGHPLGWLGSSVALYVDDDPLFAEAAGAEDAEAHVRRNLRRLPVALHCEVKSPMKLAAFLAGIRGLVTTSAPGLVTWENRTHNEQPYVVIAPTKQADDMMGDTDIRICYATRPDGFLVSLSEDLVKRALDRYAAKGEPEGLLPVFGENVSVKVDRKFLDVMEMLGNLRERQRERLRDGSWKNLAILNVWKQMYPDRDPVDVHERLFGTRPVCPGGGTYAWNAAWHTMESTVYGHPGEPKDGPAPMPFDGFKSGNFGLTFEKDGLRARCELHRAAKE